MSFIQAGVLIILSLCTSLSMAASSGDLIVSGTTITNDLAVISLDCQGKSLTTDALGEVICSNSDNVLAALVARLDALEADNITLNAQVATLQSALTANTVADTSAHHSKYTNTEAIAAVGPHSPDFSSLLAGVTRGTDTNTSQDTLRFTNMNVQVVSGSGTTSGAITGTGNLIIGYNEKYGVGDNRNGSHMLVIGINNNYSSYGGMVVGFGNTASGNWASVSGGRWSTASGEGASVSGGYANIASGNWSSVSGGFRNRARENSSSVSGGSENTASFQGASVSGGANNTASGWSSSVSGGEANEASGNWSSVSGGRNGLASGLYSSVSGGHTNIANNNYSSVSGGYTNTASGWASSVSGGQDKTAETNSCWTAEGHANC